MHSVFREDRLAGSSAFHDGRKPRRNTAQLPELSLAIDGETPYAYSELPLRKPRDRGGVSYSRGRWLLEFIQDRRAALRSDVSNPP